MSNFFKSIGRYFSRTDNILWLIIVSISIFSLVLLSSVSRSGNDFFTIQLIAIVLGLTGAVLLTLVDYRVIAKAWKWIAALCVLLLIYTLIFGITHEGAAGVSAKAWIKLPGNLTFQPSELVKIGFIITFSKHLSILKEKGKLSSFSNILFLCLHAFVPIILTHLQGDDGAAIIFFFMFIAMTFAAGVPLRYFVILFSIILAALPIAWQYVLKDYQKNRIINMFNPEADALGDGYQQIQGKISIGSGQLWGRGLFHGPRVGNNMVPIQESDLIFSVAGEELGFIGCILIIVLLLALMGRTFYVASKSCDHLGSYLCLGFFSLIATQVIFNLGMCLSLLPVMGITLPFLSAGGSSAACLYLGIGLIQNVYMNRMDTDKAGLRL